MNISTRGPRLAGPDTVPSEEAPLCFRVFFELNFHATNTCCRSSIIHKLTIFYEVVHLLLFL